MARLDLIGGAYAARSIIAAAQRCINLFPEKNPKDSPVPFTYYQRPGLTPLVQGPVVAPVRTVYRASNGNGYCVIGPKVFSISPNFALTLVGTLNINAMTPVSMADNGFTIVIGDSTGTGYTIDMASNAFAAIVDGTGSFLGTIKWDYIDTFLIWPNASDGSFRATLSNQVAFNGLSLGLKTDYPDPIVTLTVNRHQVILFGQVKSEVWYDEGLPQFPFAELPGTNIEHGIAAPYSVANSDVSTFWLSQNLQGQGMVLRQQGYTTTRVSNHAIEFAIRKMARTGIISDAIGYTYQQDGHVFYVLNFPTGDQTWVFDDSIGDPLYAWHQRGWTDPNGTLHRERANCHAVLYGKNVVGDWQNGQLYALDLDNYTDAGQPIQFVRTFPHQMHGEGGGQLLQADGRRIKFNSFAADIECGEAPLDANGNAAVVSLRWSDNRGRTFGNPFELSMGEPGQWLTQPVVKSPLGISRDRVWELSHSVAGPAALNGAWIDAEVLDS